MKKLLLSIILIVFFCSVIKSHNMQKNATQAEAMEIAIADFIKCKLSKKYSVFTVSTYKRDEFDRYKISDDLITVSISPIKTSYPDFIPWFDTTLGIDITPHAYYITLVDTLGSNRLPTRHIIKDDKLFYWRDSEYGLTQEMIDVLLKFNVAERINISNLSLLLGYEGHYDDSIKGAAYYFCKTNLNNYKRIISNIAIGWYEPPKIKCK